MDIVAKQCYGKRVYYKHDQNGGWTVVEISAIEGPEQIHVSSVEI